MAKLAKKQNRPATKTLASDEALYQASREQFGRQTSSKILACHYRQTTQPLILKQNA